MANEVGGTHSTHGRGQQSVQGFGGKERDPLEDQDVGGKMGSEWILGRLARGGGVDRIRLAQDRDQWRAVVSAVMNLRVLAPRS
jgi:hypothetical protein